LQQVEARFERYEKKAKGTQDDFSTSEGKSCPDSSAKNKYIYESFGRIAVN
jgi:hypothetical protein